ncbi:MAG: glycosyltransferase [Lachnospiraceae bacterium]|nr:glycosyltransferase [Lachnospiraceae bacterium]
MEFDFELQPGKIRNNRNMCDRQIKPLISVVTAYYNAGKYFEQTFNSVINQTFPWFEWIIVNDGSTNQDDIELLNRLVQLDMRIIIINQKNGGLSYARNVGIENSHTEIIVPLDADDLIAPQYLEYLFWGLYFNPDYSWCYTCSTGFHDEEYLWKYPWDAEKLKTYNFLNYTAAIRKGDIEEIGGYKVEKQSYFEDWRFWLEMLEKHKSPVHLGGYLFWYRRLNNGMLSTIRKNPEQEEFAKKIIEEAAKKADGTIKAKEYPLAKTENLYREPQVIDLGNEYIINYHKIHIMMIIPWMNMGGADQFNLEFLKGLDKERFDISIVTTVYSENDWQQKFECYTDKIFNLPEFLDPAYYMDFIGYYVKAKSVDVIMVTNSYTGYYMLPWLRKNFPHLCIIDYVHMEEWYWKAGGYARISGTMGGFLDKTYVCNSVTRDVMIGKFGRDIDSVKTMYIGVDVDEFCKDKVASGYLYNNYNISEDNEIILFPCRIHPQKRPFMMLDIAEKVKAKYSNVVFVVIGDGEQLNELKAAVNNRHLEKVVRCIGRSDKMKECYRDAKLTLICSLKEGLALTAYESCAMGVPVISSDVGGQRDLIDSEVGMLIKTKQDEEKAFDSRVFDSQEVDGFVDAILRLLKDEELYNKCSRNCRNKIEKAFSTKIMSCNMENEILSFVTDEHLKEQHMEMSECLKKQGNFAEEFYISYMVSETKQAECEEVWQARCYFKDVAEGKLSGKVLGKVYQRLAGLLKK